MTGIFPLHDVIQGSYPIARKMIVSQGPEPGPSTELESSVIPYENHWIGCSLFLVHG